MLVSLAWFGPAILAGFQGVVMARMSEGETNWRWIGWQAGDWLLYVLLTPIVFWLARRYRLERGALWRRIPLHVVASLVVTGIWTTAGVLLHYAIMPGRTGPYGAGMLPWFLSSMPFGAATYFAVLGVEHATWYFFRARARELQAAQLASQLEQARMHALRMQLHPHFLLNSLNAIGVVVRDRDSETAVRIVELLSDMLRRVMRTGGPTEVTLQEELDFVRHYLEVEEVRFSDRLRSTFAVDESLLDAAVPEFLLQPLVENALRHGLRDSTGLARVEIRARRVEDLLILEVHDNGGGLPPDLAEIPEGVGLGNIRSRLATMYGPRARLDLSAAAGGGVVATVVLPYRAFTTSEDR